MADRNVDIHNVGAMGVIRDISPHLLPPEAWSLVRNVRFNRRGAFRMTGHLQKFGTLLHAPAFVMNYPAPATNYWLYLSKTKASVYEGGVHTDITRTVGGDYTTINEWDWQSCLLGGIPILNNGADIPQYWPTISVATPLANMVGWPTTLRAKVVKAFGPYLLALNITESGTHQPQSAIWSNRAAVGALPADWDYTNPASDAGKVDFTDIGGGQLLDAVLLGNALVVYKETSTHIMRYVGGNDIFSPDLLLTTSGILAPKCACNVQNGTKHFVVTGDDIIVHSGVRDAQQSVADEIVKSEIFDELDSVNFASSFCFDNAVRKEAWFCYPTTGSIRPDRAAIYNYARQTWTFRDISFTAVDVGAATEAADQDWDSSATPWDDLTDPWSSQTRRVYIVADYANSKLHQLDTGYHFDTDIPVCTLERTGLALTGRDRGGQPKADFQTDKLVTRVWLRAQGTAVLNVQLGAQDHIDESVTWGAVKQFIVGVDRYIDFDPPLNTKLVAIRIESTDAEPWLLAGYDLDLSVVGGE